MKRLTMGSYSPAGSGGPGRKQQEDTEGCYTAGCIGHCAVGCSCCTVVDRKPVGLSVRCLQRSPPEVAAGGIG